MSPTTAAAAAAAVSRHVLCDRAIVEVSRIALYAALPDELPSRPLYEALAAAGRVLLFPRVGEEGRLVFAAVARWEELVAGRFGVLAPPESLPPVRLGPGDLAFVPGVAFDGAGGRLGRGQGCYDRSFPPGLPGPRLFGVGYAFQRVAAVPRDSRDRTMDAIVSERGIERIAGEPV